MHTFCTLSVRKPPARTARIVLPVTFPGIGRYPTRRIRYAVSPLRPSPDSCSNRADFGWIGELEHPYQHPYAVAPVSPGLMIATRCGAGPRCRHQMSWPCGRSGPRPRHPIADPLRSHCGHIGDDAELYSPSPDPPEEPPPGVGAIEIETDDGLRLGVWFIPAARDALSQTGRAWRAQE